MKAGWEVKSLGEACDVLDRLRKPITKKDRTRGPYPYYGATGVLDHVDGFLFDEPLVLIGEDGAKWDAGDNSAFAVAGKVWVNNHAHVVRPNRSQLSDEWLIHFLNFSDLSEFITGMTVPKLNQAKMREIPIPIPPLEEQKKIVAVLDAAFEGLTRAKENAEANLQNARELFDQALDKIYRDDLAECDHQSLDDLCQLISGQHIDAKDYNTSGDGLGYLTGPSDFGSYSPEVTKWTNKPKRTAFKDDILVTVKGSGVGKVNLMNAEELAISRQLMAVRSDHLSTKFLFGFMRLQGPYFQALANGAAIPGISRSDVLGLSIPVPSEQRQAQVAVQIEEIEAETIRLETSYRTKLTDIADLRQSLLQKAFAGELT